MPREPDAVRITTAAESRRADIAARQKRYLASMAVRTACFLAAIAVGPGWLRWVLVVGAVVLPYVAVVMANAARTKSDDFALIDNGSRMRQLPPAAGSEETKHGSDNI